MKRTKKKSPNASIVADDPRAAERESTEESPATATTPPTPGEPAADAAVPSDAELREALQARVETLENSLLRAKADYQNLQRRAATERADAVWFASADIMRLLAGVLDDFERSLAAACDSERKDPVVDGVRLVYTNLVQALRMLGLEPIDALHQPFDPQIHEAMLQQPSAEHPPGTVIEEIAKGYRLHGRVVRASKVIVSKEMEPPAEGRADVDSRESSVDPV